MGPGRSALYPFPIRYQMDSLTTIQFGTEPNGNELHGTHVNAAGKSQATLVSLVRSKVDSSVWVKHNLLIMYAISLPSSRRT